MNCNKKPEMIITDIKQEDFEQIKLLQPEGWSDITDNFKYYLDKDYCYPCKVIVENKLIGVGASIVLKDTAWLAHIIVDKNFRNQGTGYKITKHLIEDLEEKSINTILLIATAMGEPVYKKLGFKVISNYLSLKREKAWKETKISNNIIPYQYDYYPEILELDKMISGEDRLRFIESYIKNSMVYKENGEIKGFYIPDLGEGLVSAKDSKAGMELLKLKHRKVNKAVLPEENKAGINFLQENGFSEPEIKGKKMILGKNIQWKPECYYSRIGGNFG